MLIDLQKLKWYYLNTAARKDRKEHIESIMSLYNISFTRIEGLIHSNRYTSGALGMATIVKTHLSLQGKDFQPFVILEDDVSWNKESDLGSELDLDLTLEVPEDADVVHLGISNAFCLPHARDCGGKPLKIRNSSFPHLFRVYNMFSLHAVLILTESYAKSFYNAMLEAASVGHCWDTFSVLLQVPFNVYGLAKPLLYQDSLYGGQESDTRIDWSNDSDTIDKSFDPKKYYLFKNKSV